MEILKNKQNDTLVIALAGRLDTATAPELEQVIQKELDGVQTLQFDLERLEYVSSAGLRVLLNAQKTMNRQGTMSLFHVNDDVREILEITGFIDILTIV